MHMVTNRIQNTIDHIYNTIEQYNITEPDNLIFNNGSA